MKKSLTTPLIVCAVLACGGLIYLATHALAGSYLSDKNESGECSGNHKTHKAVIKDDQVKPFTVKASVCDKLTITNLDYKTRKISFGVHDRHVSYNGVTEKILNQNQSFTVTLDKTGSYIYHDHFQEETGGEFVVN